MPDPYLSDEIPMEQLHRLLVDRPTRSTSMLMDPSELERLSVPPSGYAEPIPGMTFTPGEQALQEQDLSDLLPQKGFTKVTSKAAFERWNQLLSKIPGAKWERTVTRGGSLPHGQSGLSMEGWATKIGDKQVEVVRFPRLRGNNDQLSGHAYHIFEDGHPVGEITSSVGKVNALLASRYGLGD